MNIRIHPGAAQAMVAAVLFGATVPFAKSLLVEIPPVLLAGLFYLSSGIGLSLWFLLTRMRVARARREAALGRADLPWLVGAVLVGGVLAPVLLLWGVRVTPAASASLLLNLEGVFTTLLAWFLFKENFDRRIAVGVVAITLGGVLLSWSGKPAGGLPLGALAIIAACLAWGVDNNLTRRIAAADPVQITAIKGLAAGSVNVLLALGIGASLPSWSMLALASIVGLLGYGASIALFVLALRHIGTARTSAYFSTAPFIGTALALVWLNEPAGPWLWLAGALMAFGLWLHLTERHEHLHVHEPLTHTHRHVHDLHHQHMHEPPWDGAEPHTHLHVHERLVHSHPHYPDAHHRHRHEPSD